MRAMRLPAVLSAFSAFAMAVVACSSESPRTGFETSTGSATPGEGPGGFAGNSGGPTEDPKASECQKMDLLFVVDDSGSMKEEQTNLAANFPRFVEKLNAFKTKSGASLDWRVAVTTTGRDVAYGLRIPGQSTPMNFSEKGDNGKLRNDRKCGATKRWVDKSDANAASTFSCLAEVGTSGPGLEMPLLTTRMALVDRMADGTNAGFLREDALLAIVILTDEDDCSREDNNFILGSTSSCEGPQIRPVGIFTQDFDAAAKGPGRWATAVIAGQSDCKSSFGDAAEAKRLKELVALAGKNGVFSSICDGDLTSGLDAALATFDAACRSFPGVR
jgi:hypothetical protein